MPIPKSEMPEALVKLWDMLVSAKEDWEIADALDVDVAELATLRTSLLEEKATEIANKPPEHLYVEYILAQTANIRVLSEMIKEFKTTRQHNAMVGAVRVRADLYDKIIAKGQEFGIFKKAPERRELVAGLVVSEMTTRDLKGAIVGAIGEMDKLMSRYGAVPMLEAKVGDLYHSEEPEKEAIRVAPRSKATPPKTFEPEPEVEERESDPGLMEAPAPKTKKGKAKHKRKSKHDPFDWGENDAD
jgi:hypothetical protein